VSRIITGKLRLDVRQIELAPVVGAAIDSVRPAAEAKAIEFLRELGGERIYVSGDPDRLQQIVWNLLSNAVKFTPAGGHVAIELKRRNGYATITVSDTGEGISPDFLPFVFDRFRQADSTSTRIHGGLGLGLAIVRHLTEMHGGTVEVSSEGAGRGTAFTVTLPVSSFQGP
jgi:signal transduction histidine kinase